MKRRSTNEQPLKAVIDEWLAEHPMANKAKETKVVHLWGALLGPSVKNRTKNIYFSKGKLTVRLDSSVLRNELSFAKENIVENMNKELGDEVVKEIILK